MNKQRLRKRQPYDDSTINNVPQPTLERDRAETPRDRSLKDAKRDSGPWPPDGWRIHQDAPTINLSKQDKGAETVAEALRAIGQTNDPPQIMQRDGQLVTVVRDEREVSSIRLLDRSALQAYLLYIAHWRQSTVGPEGESSTRTVLPPSYIASTIASRSGWPQSIIPPLRGLSPTPLLRPDGSLYAVPGYDAETGHWYAPNPNSGEEFRTRMESLARVTPTQADAATAVAVLHEWLKTSPLTATLRGPTRLGYS